jgi:cytoskeleton protein RodZ
MSEPTPIVLSSPDAGSRHAGDILKAARESQGISLEGLAATIKVSTAKLEALEQGQFDRLSDPNFTRALAMAVCRSLRIDSVEVLAGLPAARQMPLSNGKPPLNQPFKDTRSAPPLFDRSMTFHWSALLSFRWIAPALLLLAAVVVYVLPSGMELPAWLTERAATSASPASAVASEVEPAASLPEVASVPSTMPEAAASSVSPAASGSLVLDGVEPVAATASAAVVPVSAVASVAAPASSAQNVSLMLRATDGSWVEVRDAKGVKLVSRNILAGEALALDGLPPLRVRIGNASGMQLSFKGQPIELPAFTRNNVATLDLK